MFNAGKHPPGSTIYIPVNTFDSNDPSASVTATNWLNTDCHIHKNAGTTQRASSSGETLTIDFDTVTGNHMLAIDTSDNTTAGFYVAGATYSVRIEGVTVDAGTINAWIGQFQLGYVGAILDTGITSITDQDTFVIDSGPAEDDALNGCVALIHDVASAVQKGFAVVTDYTGSTRTVQLLAGPTYTLAATDSISFFPPTNPQWAGGVAYTATRGLAGTALPAAVADAAGGLPISDAGGLDLDAILADTADMQPKLGTPAGASISADIATVDTNVDTLVTRVPDTISLANINAEVDTAFTTQMADSVATDGVIATREQALYQVLQFLTERSVSATTVTVKKVDGSTTLYTLTLDDGTTPTSITRS